MVRIIDRSEEAEERQVEDANGVVLVPAFKVLVLLIGIHARGIILG